MNGVVASRTSLIVVLSVSDELPKKISKQHLPLTPSAEVSFSNETGEELQSGDEKNSWHTLKSVRHFFHAT